MTEELDLNAPWSLHFDRNGTEDIAMPATPATVWRAIQKTSKTRQAAE